MNFKQKGFTILEVVIVLGVLVLISGVTFVAFQNLSGTNRLEKSSQQVLSVFSSARNDSVQRRGGASFAVSIASSSLTIFEGTTFTSSASTNRKFDFSGAVFDQVSLGGATTSVRFAALSGTTSDNGTFRLRRSDNATSTTFTIYKSGVIEIQ